jgi:hypothetical protein
MGLRSVGACRHGMIARVFWSQADAPGSHPKHLRTHIRAFSVAQWESGLAKKMLSINTLRVF